MSNLSEIERDIQGLSRTDRLKLVDSILAGLDPMDAETTKKWAEEGDARYEAYLRGEIEAVDWDQVRGNYAK